jgi:hypothetical protein
MVMKHIIVALIVLTPFIGVGQINMDSLKRKMILYGVDTSSNGSVKTTQRDFDRIFGTNRDSIPVLYFDRDSLRISQRLQRWDSSLVIYPKPPDTIAVSFLVTTKDMGVAFQKDGYVVTEWGVKILYLDKYKKPIKNLIIWEYQPITRQTSVKDSKRL